MLYVCGLGNPEERYRDTPHNIGWQMVDLCAKERGVGKLVNNGRSLRVRDTIDSEAVWWIKPTTYMNKSGEALYDFNQVQTEDVVVVYDDIDLPFGQVKLSRNRGDGGHNGVKSIERVLGSRNFVRIRIGVCPLDWFGRSRKPRGREAVSNYLTGKVLARRYLERYPLLARQTLTIIESLVRKDYDRTASTLGS